MAQTLHELMSDTEKLAAAGLRLDLAGPVLTVTLDRPERRNAMTPAMWFALADVGASLPEDVRVVILRGEGAGFSAGLDRAMLTPEGPAGEEGFGALLARDDQGVADEVARYQEGFVWLADPGIISIAQIHGHAIGGGFQLALACDVRVASTDALFCMKEPALGLVPDLAGTRPLVTAVGLARALEICATARSVGAAEAERLGLVQQVVEPDDLGRAVAALAAALSAHPADAVRRTKSLLQGAAGRTLDEQRLAEREAQVPLLRALAGGTT
ncbi:enoyl-CoA hydratase/isomerase family protein [Marmoricola endophyticus]|nr:enoyl-CoA hydratase/isomerase family protein [Marmoricola endophyticus]